MKKTINILILLTFSLITISCNGNSNKDDKLIIEGQTIENKEMEKYVINIPADLQLYKEAIERRFEAQNLWLKMMDEEDLDNPELFNITEEDIFLGNKIKYSALKKGGFTPINSQEFMSKVKCFFNIDLNSFNKCKFLFPKDDYAIYVMPLYISENEESRMGGANDFERNNFFFFQTNNFITFRVPLMLSSYDNINSTTIKFVIWDNELHRNKFLLNDNQASLAWLINNDIEFLEVLIREFGYDKNTKINEAVLTKVNKDYLSKQPKDKGVLENLFARKNCEGSLQISDNLMEYVANTSDREYETPLDMLYDYASLMAGIHSDFPVEFASKFSKKERFKIAAYAGYYEQLARDKNNIDNPESPLYTPEGWYPGSFLRNELARNKELLEEIKKNDYYGLLNYKDMIETVLNQIEE